MLAALAVAAPVAAETRQQIYDAAQAAYDKGDWTTAATGFRRILAPPGKGSRADGVIRYRYATALGELDRADEALAEAKRATTEFADGVDADRALAFFTLAKLYHVDFRNDAAADVYEVARDAAPADNQMRYDAAIGVMRAAAVFDPPRAIRTADALIADPGFAARSKDERAQALALKARAELNGGKAKEARETIAKAVALTGSPGGNAKVNLMQAIIRGDAALIYARIGDMDTARRYLAFSGGGYLPQTNWWGDGNRQPPVCDDDVHPDDVAVVAFMLDENGRPIGADTVYASRPGPMGAAFARAVRGWDASPAAGKLSAFWRYSLRIEMRCVTRPAAIAIAQPFEAAASTWKASRRPPPSASPADTGRSGKPADPLAARMVLLARSGKLLELDDLLAANGASVDVRASMILAVQTIRESRSSTDMPGAELAPLLRRIEAAPDGGRPAAWIRLETGLLLERLHRSEAARSFFDTVLAMPEAKLAGDDAIRLVATIHLSMIDQQQGASAASTERLKRAGIDAAQCSQFDVRPLAINTRISDSAFPTDALRWGFDGFVKEAFDIAADGHVTDVRTVIAYPPFVFGPASERAVAKFRFQPPTLDGQVLGCSSQMRSIRYSIPR